MNIAVIPARGGSQRIPHKNIKLFCGRPMISYAIELALSSKYIDKVFVSTDDDNIAEIAIKYGALVPFLRPENISDHVTPTVPVISHAIKHLENQVDIDNVCCIYPCSPIIKFDRLDQAYERMIDGKHLFAYPVSLYSHPIQRAMKMNSFGKMEYISSQYELARTQDLDKTFHDTGQFYWGTLEAWTQEKKMHTDGIGIEINSWEYVDIDNEEDWKKAEVMKRVLDKIL